MLVCNVSARPRGRQIAGELAEGAAAVDAAIPGILFVDLVDDPASASETINAFVGNIIVEEASAIDEVTTGLIYAASVDEAVTTADTQSAATAVAITKSAMLPGPISVFVNSGISRQTHVGSVMVNL